MFRWLRVPIRTALLMALLVACTAPLLGYWYWSYSAALTNEYDEVRKRHLLTAQNVSDTLARYHRDVVSVFASFAPAFARGEKAEGFGDALEALDFECACAFDRETGRLTAAALKQRDLCPARLPEDRLSYYQLVAGAEGEVAMTSTGHDPAMPTRIFLITDVEDAIVIGAITTAHIAEIGESVRFGEKGHAAIVDQTGRVLAHPMPDWRAEARDISSVSAVRRILAGQQGVDFFFSPAMKELVVAAYTPVEGAGWGVMVAQPVAELEARARALTNAALYAVAAAVAISVLISLFCANTISRPIRRGADAARRMARGEPAAPLGERETARALTEIRDLSQSFNSMAAQIAAAQAQEKRLRLEAERATRAKTMFLANISHEIRTPMNGILGVAALMKETPLNPRQAMLLEKIDESGKGLLRIVNDVLDSTRIEEGYFEVRPGRFDLRALVSSVADLAAAQLTDGRVAIALDHPGEGPDEATGDADRVRQVLLNLVQNAIRHTTEGKITLAVAPHVAADGAEGRKISVIDTGPGVPERMRAVVFERFVQAEPGETAALDGAGLGLSIASSLVRAMGGEIGLDETPGGGATFWFTLVRRD